MALSNFGVYSDIEESTYYYERDNFRYYFTSEFYKNNFIKKIDFYVCEEFRKLRNRYSIDEDLIETETIRLILKFNLYKKIEKRGFRIYWKGRDGNWQRIQKSDGQEVTM